MNIESIDINDLSDDQFEELDTDFVEDLHSSGSQDYGDDFIEEEDSPIDEIAPELLDKSQTFEPTATVVEPKHTKSEMARKIFNAHYGKPGMARKDVIKMLMDQCNMGKAYAGTFYQNESKKLKK